MRLTINQIASSGPTANGTQAPAKTHHTDACTAVNWSLSGELFSCSDDSTVWKWNMNGEPIAKVCEIDSCFTELKWFPMVNTKKGGSAGDMFVVACADGTFRMINAVTGRVEKQVPAHTGAVVCLAWNWDGTALVTGGEDGVVKLWSQSGINRSTVASTGVAVHSLAWGPESDVVLFTHAKELVVKPLQPSSKQLQWKAHDSVILKVDWSPVTNLIISGGEDGRYKVWDSYGRNLYSSAPLDWPVSSVGFSPDGEMFAVGSFNILRICDKTGWSHCRENTDTGSILNLSWTTDCTQLACAGGNGSVLFAQLIDRRIEYKNLVITLADPNKIQVQDVKNVDSLEDLSQRDRVIKMSAGYGYLVVATSTQCCVYNVQNLNQPCMFDVKDTVNLICQADKIFLLMDHLSGLQIFQYDGRPLATLKLQGVRTEFLNYQSVSLSPDMVVVKDTFDPKCVKVFEALTGRPAGFTITHHMEIMELALSQYGPQLERKLALVDRNRDLYICTVDNSFQMHKLATMVASVKWNDHSEILIAIADGKLAVWYYPSVVYIDRDLLNRTKHVYDDYEFGRNDQILDFFGSRCTIRRGFDGATLTHAVKPYPNMLFQHVHSNAWDAAVKLCRLVKEESLWSILAALAIKHGELNTAEVAYAAVEEADKVQYVKYIAEIPTAEGRNAELVLFQRKPKEAENILLQANLIYRAIRMHIKLFNWQRALEISIQHKKHIDTVLGYRQRYLQTFNKEETNRSFLSDDLKEIEIDWENIHKKIEQEKKDEAERPGATPYQG